MHVIINKAKKTNRIVKKKIQIPIHNNKENQKKITNY